MISAERGPSLRREPKALHKTVNSSPTKLVRPTVADSIAAGKAVPMSRAQTSGETVPPSDCASILIKRASFSPIPIAKGRTSNPSSHSGVPVSKYVRAPPGDPPRPLPPGFRLGFAAYPLGGIRAFSIQPERRLAEALTIEESADFIPSAIFLETPALILPISLNLALSSQLAWSDSSHFLRYPPKL